jgi:diguanylate cyclase (GGDEF)-like protein/PAS domain S-box-containing protein
MNFLDVRTVMLSTLTTDALCTWVIFSLWLNNRKRFSGTSFWVANYFFQTAAVLLLILRDLIPVWLSLELVNPLMIIGALLGYIGLERFVEKTSRQTFNYILLGAFSLVNTYFSLIQPDLNARTLFLSLAFLIIFAQCTWLIFYRVRLEMRRMTLGVGLVFGLLSLVSIIRVFVTLASPHPENDFFKSGLSDTLILMTYQLLTILLAYNLSLVINRRLIQNVQYQEEKFTKAFNSSSLGLTLTRLSDGRIMEVNDGFVNITGYQRQEVIGKKTKELPLWSNEEDRLVLVKTINEGRLIQGEEIVMRSKSGELLTGLLSAEIIQINQEPFILGSINDITGRKKAEEALRESEERYRQVVKNANEAILVAQEGMIRFHNPKAMELSGYTEEELLDKPFVEFIHPEDRGLVLERHQKRLQGGSLPQIYSFRIIDKQENIKWAEINTVVMSWKGKPATLNFLIDITERKEMEERLRRMSIIDDLTGLYNRRGFLTLAQQQLKVAERNRKEMTLFFADLDNMKWINDTLGHLEGDHALMDVAAVLKESFRESDILSRIGGDEFAILALETAEINPDMLVLRLNQGLKDFNQQRIRPYNLSLSIGLARYTPNLPLSIDHLLAEADRRMYAQKRNRNNQRTGPV